MVTNTSPEMLRGLNQLEKTCYLNSLLQVRLVLRYASSRCSFQAHRRSRTFAPRSPSSHMRMQRRSTTASLRTTKISGIASEDVLSPDERLCARRNVRCYDVRLAVHVD